MLHATFSLYLGKEHTKGFSGFIAEDVFFLVLETSEGLSKEKGTSFLHELKKSMQVHEFDHLLSFESYLREAVKNANLPVGTSIAAVYVKDAVAYLQTIGEGEIFLKRGDQFMPLINGEKNASGYVQEHDFFVVTTKRFTSLLGNEHVLEKVVLQSTAHSIVNELMPYMHEEDNGAIALFVNCSHVGEVRSQTPDARSQMSKELEERDEDTKEAQEDTHIVAPNVPKPSRRLQLPKLPPLDRKRLLTFAAVGLIFIVLIWSVVMGIQRRANDKQEAAIKASKQLIEYKLSQSQDVAFLNMPRSLELLKEAHDEFNKLKQTVGTTHQDEIEAIQKELDARDNGIVKKENKPSEEFYDLHVEDSKATGDKMALDGDTVAITDGSNHAVYLLSLSKKSIEKRTAPDVQSESLVALNGDEVIVYTPNGVFTVNASAKKVIDKDSDWGSIAGLAVYNGNIYLMDSSKDDIYKYLVADKGYSNKTSYFKGTHPDLSSASSLAIDSSLYISAKDSVLKYTSGLLDSFKTTFPNKSVNLDKVIATKDSAKVYAWDKQASTIYVLEKDGTYDSQISSDILGKATDTTVFNNDIYCLQGSKVYKISGS